jgi:DNA adenine methylase
MADWIIKHMPEHTTYLEPFFGSGAVFFNKSRSPLETVNDLDGDVVNLFKVIRDRPEELAHLVRLTPYAREEYYFSYEETDDELEQARRFFVRCWMARGARSSGKSKTGWRHVIDINARSSSPAVEWMRLPKKILAVVDRLQGVQIENQPALKLIERYMFPNVLIYADPPYVLSTRRGPAYRHEMTDDDHEELLNALDAHPGPVLLSGYANTLYDERLKHWRRETKVVLAEAGKKRTEVLWINPVAAEQMGQLTIFDAMEAAE